MRTLAIAVVTLALLGTAGAQDKVPDLYNLGPLGGKAELITKDALKVHSVVAGGPAAKAGLKPDDIVYGAAGKGFGDNAYLELGDAILAAEAADPPVCELMIRRGDTEQKLPVTLTRYTDEAARRKAITDAALKWLADEQDGEGAFRSTLSPEVSCVVLTSLAGLCWLTDSTPHEGRYAKNIVKAAAFVMEHVGEQKDYRRLKGKNNDQTNWSLGYGGIFLAHVLKAADAKWLRRSEIRRIEAKLRWVRDRIFKQAEENGGFAAGPGGENLLGYVHLEVMSNFCLAALGCMKQASVDVDEEKLAPLVAYVEKCQGEHGGIHYAHDKLWGPEVGRTAGAMNALASLKLIECESYPRMRAYFEKHHADAFGGHSTPTMHQLSVALAAKRHGMLDKYRHAQRREFTMVRNPDHTFASRPTADTLRMGMNIDRDLGRVWTTAHWVLILNAEKACPLWAG